MLIVGINCDVNECFCYGLCANKAQVFVVNRLWLHFVRRRRVDKIIQSFEKRVWEENLMVTLGSGDATTAVLQLCGFEFALAFGRSPIGRATFNHSMGFQASKTLTHSRVFTNQLHLSCSYTSPPVFTTLSIYESDDLRGILSELRRFFHKIS